MNKIIKRFIESKSNRVEYYIIDINRFEPGIRLMCGIDQLNESSLKVLKNR